jgi:hypothetical protein
MKPYYDVVREVLKYRDGCSDRCEGRSGSFSFARRIMEREWAHTYVQSPSSSIKCTRSHV